MKCHCGAELPPGRRVCDACKEARAKAYKADCYGVFPRGSRKSDAEIRDKYYGKALFLRNLRIAKYQQFATTEQPIPYEQRFGT